MNLGLENVNLLFPDDTYDDLQKDNLKLGIWLSSIFDLWLNDKKIKIDQFEILINLLYGADPNLMGDEYYGTRFYNTFIIETNNDLQANDPLRVCSTNYKINKLNLNKNRLEELLDDPLANLYYYTKKKLCIKCENCSLSNICSGGYLINRYSKNNGFDNPSIYCESLAYFITHVQNKIAEFTNPKLALEKRIEKINIDEILNYCRTEQKFEKYELSKFKETHINNLTNILS